jgi:TetR/AcrR family hemagglutinin/protease transcriptional regulator
MAREVKRQWMRTADRRAQLLESAIGVFARDGIGRATHATIAEESGVSVATVFVHFPNREALVHDVLEAVDAAFSAMIRATLRSHADTREALLALARAFADSIDTHPDQVRVWLDWSTAVSDPNWTGWLDFQKRALRSIRHKIRSGVRAGTVNPQIDVDAAARIFNGASHIVALMKFGAARPADVDRMLVHLVDSALHIPLQGDGERQPGRNGVASRSEPIDTYFVRSS